MKLSRFLPLGIDKKPVIRWLWGGALLGLVFQIFFTTTISTQSKPYTTGKTHSSSCRGL